MTGSCKIGKMREGSFLLNPRLISSPKAWRNYLQEEPRNPCCLLSLDREPLLLTAAGKSLLILDFLILAIEAFHISKYLQSAGCTSEKSEQSNVLAEAKRSAQVTSNHLKTQTCSIHTTQQSRPKPALHRPADHTKRTAHCSFPEDKPSKNWIVRQNESDDQNIKTNARRAQSKVY